MSKHDSESSKSVNLSEIVFIKLLSNFQSVSSNFRNSAIGNEVPLQHHLHDVHINHVY